MPMLLRGRNESEFEFALIEDRFPDLQDDAGDSGWVTLAVRAANHNDQWEQTSPCVNLYEVQNLAEWLEAVAESRPDVGEIDLLEPGLNLSIARGANGAGAVRVAVHLAGGAGRFP